MALTRREQAEYDRLRAKRGGSGSKTPSGNGRPRSARAAERDDDEGIFVLAGRHAESFLDRMFGASTTTPADAEPDDDDDEDLDDEDEDPEPDPEPSRGHRYFSGRRPRG